MTHTVIAPLVIARGSDGKDVYLYQGSPVPPLPEQEVARLSEGGFIREDIPEPSEDGNEGAPQRPAESGPGSAKEKWVAYAAAVDVQIDPDGSKDDIIAALTAAGH